MQNKEKNNILKIIKVESLRIGLASPERIRKWAERTLPSGKIIGEVTSSQTVNYKTLKPEKDGLFCEAIFGPIKDFECACGKKRSKSNQKYCPECSVEFTSSRVRRHRLGYINLISPVAHVWYLRGTPSYLSILLDLPRKKLEGITYCTETTNINILLDNNKEKNKKSENIPQSCFYGTSIFEDFDFIQSNNELSKALLLSERSSGATRSSNNEEQNNLLLSNEINSQEAIINSSIEKVNTISKSNILSSAQSFAEQFYTQNCALEHTPRMCNNNYYSIAQDSSWEIQDDWASFMYFMSSNITEFDKTISSYMNRMCVAEGNSMGIDPKENNFFFQRSQIQLTGAQAIRYLLSNLNLPFLDKQLRVELFEINEEIALLENQEFILFGEQKRLHFLLYMRVKKLRRLKLIRNFRRTKTKPEWMILTVLPVLPPDLRPIIQLDGDQVAVSDLNKLYQKVLFRNNRMKRHRRTNSSTKSDEMKYAQRLLQEAVDALIENGKGGSDPICASNERPLKSLSDMLKGKKGRFRQNLLGKRVDYSGRSVIVVGPQLKIHECGLPKEMAMELFQPFLIRKLMGKKIVRTIVGAKRLIQTHNPVIWEALRQVMQNHPVLLNRAPTLHRLGIQCFQPKLVDGRAILLHPLVCPAFNADFDGDQMAVHVPLTFEARAEAWKLMWSRNNILSSATGQPIVMPSQDMVLGCYYLTTINTKIKNSKNLYFFNIDDIITAYNQKKIALHEFCWVKWNKSTEVGNKFQFPLEIRINFNGNQFHFYSQYQKVLDQNGLLKSQFVWTTPGRAVFNNLIHYSLSI